MRRLLVLVVLGLAACGDEEATPDPTEPKEELAPGPAVDTNTPPPPPADTQDEPLPAPAATPANPNTPPQCGKHITVIATVGVPGASKYVTNGCWSVTVTDGAAVPTLYRKCSTSNYQVQNPAAPSWAYDDTNPEHPLATEKTFLQTCAKNATGDGWEFMAYRGGWRLLTANHLKAYFAELYGSPMTDIDSLWYVNGVYKGNAVLAQHNDVYPMINFGTPKASNLHTKMGQEALKICKTVKDGGYFGVYNAAWREGMPAGDPRLVALQNALDACTKK